MKRRFIYSGILVIAFGAGYFTKYWFDSSRPWRYATSIDGLNIVGELSQLKKDDIEAVRATVSSTHPSEIILEIRFVSSEEVEIRTGVVDGPLSGGGRYFTFKKKGGKWIEDESKRSNWMG